MCRFVKWQVKDRTEKFIQPDHKTVPFVWKVEKVTNIKLELAFLKAQKELIDPTAPTQLLFHGTSDEGVKGITHDGFRLPAGEARKMFGQVRSELQMNASDIQYLSLIYEAV